jgi:DNA-directed RNA polymerase subunit L
MLAEIIDSKDSQLELKLQEEDISIMYIMQHELLKEFAGVTLKHPLIKEYVVRITTRKKDPLEAVQEASVSASEHIKELTSALKTALKK